MSTIISGNQTIGMQVSGAVIRYTQCANCMGPIRKTMTVEHDGRGWSIFGACDDCNPVDVERMAMGRVRVDIRNGIDPRAEQKTHHDSIGPMVAHVSRCCVCGDPPEKPTVPLVTKHGSVGWSIFSFCRDCFADDALNVMRIALREYAGMSPTDV